MPPRVIAGRRVAVTGGARGIGAAIAATLTRAGAHVAVGDLHPTIGALTRLQALLPQVGRDALTRTLVPDQLRRTDQQARAAYEARSVTPQCPELDSNQRPSP